MTENAQDKKTALVKLSSSEVAGNISRHDALLLTRAIQLEETEPPQVLTMSVRAIILLIIVFFVWAALATFAEKAIAPGEIIPTTLVQPIQNLEGGIIQEVLVEEGQKVKDGDIVLKIDDTKFRSELKSLSARHASLVAERERLEALVEGRDPDFSALADAYPTIVANEMGAYATSFANWSAQKAAVAAQVRSRRSEVSGLQEEVAARISETEALKQTVDIRKELEEEGFGAKIQRLEAERVLGDAAAELAGRKTDLARAQASLAETQSRQLELDEQLRKDSLEQISRLNGEIGSLDERMVAIRDQIDRSSVRATIEGRVNGLVANQKGAVVRPGDLLMSIVPVQDSLVAEVRVSPRDVGHVILGQNVLIRVDTYKYGQYGGVEGTVVRISPDTFIDDQGQAYFKTWVQLSKNHVGKNEANLIATGMTVVADIKTGEKSLLAYLLRPVRNSLQVAFSER
ncbi:HlyD family type I secretion membrane fusion protein [Kordiimonas sediminis]|uniref:Membrane fusion protein (MFP) family protein n=1 Tax=Kordiimonas sediminis TaxID=1735581 RepID=A0A919ANU9_9PROT|nr:HlyD family type I secretion periplasmic adaptor subunit [Kordiimonas sediminis]GHF14978.1 HlyD family type I secretion membrane fusion protein [Kordiimonas sediminis]